jgi:hypothetical protein
MFFDDRPAAAAEMRRVLRSGHRLALAVWSSVDRSPGYAALETLLADLFGDDAATALRYPFALGDVDEITRLLTDAGFASIAVSRVPGVARFASIDDWMFTEIRGWTLAGAIDDAAFDRLLEAARRDLAEFEKPDRSVAFPVEALIATASA